jgi:hypothetical protein
MLSMMVGIWMNPETMATTGQFPWWLWLSGSGENPLFIKSWEGSYLYFEQNDGGADYINFSANPVALKGWHYGILRVGNGWIRSQSILPNGAWGGGSNAVASTAMANTGLNFYVGTNQTTGFKAHGAELFICSPDPFAGYGNADIPKDIVRQCAYYGAASIPHVLSNLVFYQSFWNGLAPVQNGHYCVNSGSHLVSDIVGGNAANQHARWQGQHPPLAPGYMRPNNPIATRII